MPSALGTGNKRSPCSSSADGPGGEGVLVERSAAQAERCLPTQCCGVVGRAGSAWELEKDYREERELRPQGGGTEVLQVEKRGHHTDTAGGRERPWWAPS